MRAEKQSIAEDLEHRLEGSGYVILADYHGLSVERTRELRARLREADTRMLVVKNRLLAHAARAAGLPDLAAGLPPGPTAMFYGPGDVVQASKALLRFIKEHELPVVKLGAMEGKLLSPEQVSALASLPGRPELLQMTVGTLAAPLTQLAGVLHQKLASLVYALKAVEEKKAQGA
jgi:large subunit ribosomal protein L10